MDKKKCSSCGEAPHKCSCKNKEFTKAVIEINNPEQITLMRRVVIPASMGDDTAVPPAVGKYKNVLLFYEANSKSYMYSSDGIPTLLANGLTDYEQAVNLPQINGVTLVGDKTATQLGLQDKLTAGDNISIDADNVISAVDTTYGPATDSTIGLVKPGDGLEVDTDGTLSISDIEQYTHFFDTVADTGWQDVDVSGATRGTFHNFKVRRIGKIVYWNGYLDNVTDSDINQSFGISLPSFAVPGNPASIVCVASMSQGNQGDYSKIANFRIGDNYLRLLGYSATSNALNQIDLASISYIGG